MIASFLYQFFFFVGVFHVAIWIMIRIRVWQLKKRYRFWKSIRDREFEMAIKYTGTEQFAAHAQGFSEAQEKIFKILNGRSA